MALREFVFENLIGDLEYHPKRALVYLGLGVAALCVWIFTPSDTKSSAIPLVFGVGSLALLLKGIFLLRKTSDGFGISQQGLGLSQHELARLSSPSAPKTFPSIPSLAAQIIQDFATGGVILGPLLHIGRNINDSWKDLPSLPVFIAGAILFLLGWLIRTSLRPRRSGPNHNPRVCGFTNIHPQNHGFQPHDYATIEVSP